MHDPRVGRFFARDPLEAKYPWFSPYQFSGNTPIMAIELEGLESSAQPNKNETNESGTSDFETRDNLIEEVVVMNKPQKKSYCSTGNNDEFKAIRSIAKTVSNALNTGVASFFGIDVKAFDKMYAANKGNYDAKYHPSTDWRFSAGICALPAIVVAAEAGLIGAGCSYAYSEGSAYIANFSWSSYFGKAGLDFSMELFANNGHVEDVNFGSVAFAGLGNTRATNLISNGLSSSFSFSEEKGFKRNNFNQFSVNFAGGLIGNSIDNKFNSLQKSYGKGSTKVMLQTINVGMQTVSKTSANYLSNKNK